MYCVKEIYTCSDHLLLIASHVGPGKPPEKSPENNLDIIGLKIAR